MIRYQEIENRLLEIDGVLFQNICDALLYYTEENYPNIFRSGSKIGKLRAVKGTPDTFFMLPNGRYILVEYTVQDPSDHKALITKIKGDIDKCLDSKKTGLALVDIERIIYCCTASFGLKESKELRDYCREKGVKLDLKGIDTIARILSGRCTQVAREFLGIAIDTGQVLSPEVFAQEYESSGLATRLTNTFMHREEELKLLLTSIASEIKITIITGPAGTGKSKLAMQAFEMVKKSNPTTLCFCITNKNTSIHDDLRIYLAQDGDYLILVDDANRQSGHLESILAILREKRNGNIHVLVTVRDYAFEDTKLRCKDFLPEVVEVGAFSDEHLTSILTGPDFNITHEAVKRVLEVSNGNPRLAIMATKVALESNNLAAIADVSGIYDRYFEEAIGEGQLFKDRDLQKSLGLLSFFFSFNLEDVEFTKTLTSLFGLEVGKFHESLIAIEKMELAETTSDFSMIKIADQVFGTYFFYRTFIRDGILDFRIIMKNYFSSHQGRIRDSVVPANNTFSYKNVYPKIDPILSVCWTEISAGSEQALQFLKLFWFYRADDVFAYVAKINAREGAKEHAIFLFDEKADRYHYDRDEYLSLLENFFSQPIPEIRAAIELSIEYVECFPQRYTQLVNSLKTDFVFTARDESVSNMRQLTLWEILISEAGKGRQLCIDIFFELAPELMKTAFKFTSAGRKGDTIAFNEFKMRITSEVSRFRTLTWEFMLDHFTAFRSKVEAFLLSYLAHSSNKQKAIFEFDLEYFLAIIDKYFDTTQFEHCYIVRDMIYHFTRCELVHQRFAELKSSFNNESYRYYVLLSWDRLRDKFDHNYEYNDFNKYERIKEIEIRRAFSFSTSREFNDFYAIFLKVYDWKKNGIYQFLRSLNIILEELFERDAEQAILALDLLISSSNKSGLVPDRIFRNVWRSKELAGQLFENILAGNFSNRTSWILSFIFFTPKENLSEYHLNEYLNLLTTTTDTIAINNNSLKVLSNLKPEIVPTVLAIVVERIELEDIHHLIDQSVFLENMPFPESLVLIKKAYLQQDRINVHFDYNLEAFLEIVKADKAFFMEYITEISKEQHNMFSTAQYADLKKVWELEGAEEIILQVMDFMITRRFYFVDDHWVNLFFEGLSEEYIERGKLLLGNYLKDNVRELRKVDMVMNIARHALKGLEDEFIVLFLYHNPNFDDFRKISWLDNYFMGGGNVIWADVRARRLEEILLLFEKVGTKKYLYADHQNFLKNWIAGEKRSADSERKHIFMYGD